MKKPIFLTIIICIVLFSLFGCSTPSEKGNNSSQNISSNAEAETKKANLTLTDDGITSFPIQTYLLNGDSIELSVICKVVEDVSNFTGYYVSDVLECVPGQDTLKQYPDMNIEILNIEYFINHQKFVVRTEISTSESECEELSISVDLYDLID